MPRYRFEMSEVVMPDLRLLLGAGLLACFLLVGWLRSTQRCRS